MKKTAAKEVAKEKEVTLKSHITLGISEDGRFIWSVKNVANLFEALGYIRLAEDEILKKIREA